MNPNLYESATWMPLTGHSAPGNVANRKLIVLHITQGPTAASAIDTFKSSVAPHRVSAHFVIDRDGTVYQLLDLNDTAWHASACNPTSVGIEHAAMVGTLMATDDQYDASSKLVAWLCTRLNVPCDRDHVKTHNEVSPQDGHTLCCTGALDPDRVVAEALTAGGA